MKTFLMIIIILYSFCFAKSDLADSSDSTFLRLRVIDFRMMDQSQLQYYKKFVATCKNDVLCHDRNVQSLINKEVFEMTDNEFEMFQCLVQNCDTLNPCRLFQCEFLNGKDKKQLTENEVNFCEYCNKGCKEYGKKYYPSKAQKMEKVCKLSMIFLGSFCAIICCSVMLLP
jgi:hypothetical protein